MVALEFLLGSQYEIVIVGKQGTPSTQSMLNAVRRRFIPNKVLLFRPLGDDAAPITSLAPYTQEMKTQGGKTTAYVCRNFSCGQPVTRIDEMLGLLGAS
jgi:uncharacterized protein YyaL (SSP411 family)